MGRKLLIVLLVMLLAIVAGFLIYKQFGRRMENLPGPLTSTPKNQPSLPTANPAEPSKPGGLTSKSEGPAEPSGFSPRSGETLEFDANVTKLNSTVAGLKVVVGERQSIAGKSALHLQAFAHTQNPYRMVFELDDQFDSYSDPANLHSLQYELHLSERGQKVDSVERMLPSLNDPAPAGFVAARVLPGTRDPLGMLMYLRSVNWSKTNEVRCPVYDGHKLYDVRASLAGKSQGVSVPAGKYTATKIEIHVMENGAEMKDAHFLLYLSDTAERLPVLMEAVLPVATARVELTKVH